MKRINFSKYLLLLNIVILITSGCGEKTTPLPLLANGSVILAFGDSLTYGYNANRSESYPAKLEVLTGLSVINAGVSGEVSEQGLKRLPKVLDEYHPQLMILCHGGNDLLRKKDLKEMESNIRSMIQLSLDRGIPVILLGVPKPGIFLSSFDVYEKIANSMDIIFIEDLISDILGDKSLKSDSIHPNKKGYNVMAEEIYSLLLDKGAI
ncbi:MAG: arylesterase [Pseudomonadota bacterium]|nr:arylesterase [Pseudomonadota bacterium]